VKDVHNILDDFDKGSVTNELNNMNVLKKNVEKEIIELNGYFVV
tara:strand:- start:696 stop:827 length:132 start_codon:yes stop_codon:yes gene_type:complete